MNIAFIDPEWPGFGHRTQRWPHKNLHGDINPPPLFQMSAATIARQNGHSVLLHDAPAERLSNAELIRQIGQFDADLVVVNSSTPSFDHDLRFIRELRSEGFLGKVLMVGPHSSIYWEETLRDCLELDYIAIGEYDEIPSKLCDAQFDPGTIDGLVYRNREGSIVKNKPALPVDLNAIPPIDYSLVPLENYNEFLFPIRKKPIATIMTSRGCPFKCSFCLYPQVLFGHKLRFRKIEDVIDEIDKLQSHFGVKFVYLEDDTFTANWGRVEQFCEQLLQRKIKISWGCLGRVSGVTDKRLQLMKNAGCYLIKYGVETATPEQLKNMKKGLDLQEIENAFTLTRKSGIYSHATVMFGCPGDTLDTITRTQRFLKKLKPDYVQFSICTPFPGTLLYEECQTKGFLDFQSWEDFDGAWGGVIETAELTRHQTRTAVQEGYKTYYLTLDYLFLRLYRSLRGPDIFSQWLQNVDLLRRFITRYILKVKPALLIQSPDH